MERFRQCKFDRLTMGISLQSVAEHLSVGAMVTARVKLIETGRAPARESHVVVIANVSADEPARSSES